MKSMIMYCSLANLLETIVRVDVLARFFFFIIYQLFVSP